MVKGTRSCQHLLQKLNLPYITKLLLDLPGRFKICCSIKSVPTDIHRERQQLLFREIIWLFGTFYCSTTYSWTIAAVSGYVHFIAINNYFLRYFYVNTNPLAHYNQGKLNAPTPEKQINEIRSNMTPCNIESLSQVREWVPIHHRYLPSPSQCKIWSCQDATWRWPQNRSKIWTFWAKASTTKHIASLWPQQMKMVHTTCVTPSPESTTKPVSNPASQATMWHLQSKRPLSNSCYRTHTAETLSILNRTAYSKILIPVH